MLLTSLVYLIDNGVSCKHGGWVDGSAAQTGYVSDSANNALTVPMALAL